MNAPARHSISFCLLALIVPLLVAGSATAIGTGYQRACNGGIPEYCVTAMATIHFDGCNSSTSSRTCYYILMWNCEGSGTTATAAVLTCDVDTSDGQVDGASQTQTCSWGVLQAGCRSGTHFAKFAFSPGWCGSGLWDFGTLESSVDSLLGDAYVSTDAWDGIVYPDC